MEGRETDGKRDRKRKNEREDWGKGVLFVASVQVLDKNLREATL